MKNFDSMSNEQVEAAVVEDMAVSGMFRCLYLSIASAAFVFIVWGFLLAAQALNASLMAFFTLD